jgi:hypothetical protein
VHLESAKREPIVRGDKDTPWQVKLGDVERLNYGKSVQPGHLHIQENKIRPVFFYRGDGGLSAVGLAHNVHPRLFAQQSQHFPARGRFVVDDQNSKWRLRAHSAVCEG